MELGIVEAASDSTIQRVELPLPQQRCRLVSTALQWGLHAAIGRDRRIEYPAIRPCRRQHDRENDRPHRALRRDPEMRPEEPELSTCALLISAIRALTNGYYSALARRANDKIMGEVGGGGSWNRTRHGSPRRIYSPLPHLAAHPPHRRFS